MYNCLLSNDLMSGNYFKGAKEKQIIASLVRFCSFVDSGKCLRLGGHLNYATLMNVSKHLIILPKRHPLTHLVMKDIRESCGYLAYNYVLSKMQGRFWLINSISSMSHYLRQMSYTMC